MIKAFFWKRRWIPYAYGGAAVLLACMYGQIHIAVMLNTWHKRFYDLFEDVSRHSLSDFYGALIEYLIICGLSILVSVAASALTRVYTFWWREALTFFYIPLWRIVPANIEGASQRIQEDVYRAAKVIESLGWAIASTLMTLVAFVPILWHLSNDVRLPYLMDIPGSLVWVSFAASVGGFLISWVVGSKLPVVEYDAQKVEAVFRKVLVYGENHKTRVRDAFEAALRRLFRGTRINNNRLILHSSYFDVWKYSYMKGMDILPFLLLVSSVFAGAMTFGDLMQTKNAFSQVTDGFSVFINNWHMITEIRSIKRRLGEFEHSLHTHEHGPEESADHGSAAAEQTEVPPEAAGN
jgi:peptide/bleomycin uptake transporter